MAAQKGQLLHITIKMYGKTATYLIRGGSKGRGTNRLSVARWLEKIELASRLALLAKAFNFAKTSREKL